MCTGQATLPTCLSGQWTGSEHSLLLFLIQHLAPMPEKERNSKALACHLFNRHSKRKFINSVHLSKWICIWHPFQQG